MFVHKFFTTDVCEPVKELATHINAAFCSLNVDKCDLRYAAQQATQEGTPLCDYLVDDILRLRDLLDRAYATPDGAEWVRDALRNVPAVTHHLLRDLVAATNHRADVGTPKGPPSRRRRIATIANLEDAITRVRGK